MAGDTYLVYRGGVYTITCVVTGDQYVGQTLDFDKRWASHQHALRRGKHTNHRLQVAWDLFGESAFVFCEVEESIRIPAPLPNPWPQHVRLSTRESFWIRKLRPSYNCGVTLPPPPPLSRL